MSLVFFIGWVVLVFACSDLVGSALQPYLFDYSPRRQAQTISRDSATDEHVFADFVRCTLSGFAALWTGLSAAYAIGVATRSVIVVCIVAAAVAAALIRRRSLAGWIRSRAAFWGLIGAAALLSSLATPTLNGADDGEYFFLVSKLLQTGSIHELFNYRRPITLGGWTFIQAIFSAGPAGLALAPSIDAVAGGVLFLFGALLLGADAPLALPAALIGVLSVRGFQANLGTAIAMAAASAILVGVSVRSRPRDSPFTPIALAVMAATIRPQLGLIAVAGVAVVLARARGRSLLTAVATAAGLSVLWIAIFARDTGFLPLSTSPGYNPQSFELYADHPANEPSLPSKVIALWDAQPVVVGLLALAFVICAWRSVTTRRGDRLRGEYRVLAAFSIAAGATVLGMFVVLGARSLEYRRYYIPVVTGVTYAILIASGVHVLRRLPAKLATAASLALATTAAVLWLAIGLRTKHLSVPSESSATTICHPLLSAGERHAFGRLSGSGYTLLAIDCPAGNFDAAPQTMMSDLFFATRGDYFDIAWDPEQTAAWLRKENVDRVVYLDKDTSWTFGLDYWRASLAKLEADPDPSEFTAARRREYSYQLKSLQKIHDLAGQCDSLRMPIADPQGPLVVVDVRQCANGVRRSPTAGAFR